jgi:hypothetical protein
MLTLTLKKLKIFELYVRGILGRLVGPLAFGFRVE